MGHVINQTRHHFMMTHVYLTAKARLIVVCLVIGPFNTPIGLMQTLLIYIRVHMYVASQCAYELVAAVAPMWRCLFYRDVFKPVIKLCVLPCEDMCVGLCT